MKKLLLLLIFPFCVNAHGSITQTKICKTDMVAYRKKIENYSPVNLYQRLPSLSKFTTCKSFVKPAVKPAVKPKKPIVKKFVKTKGKL